MNKINLLSPDLINKIAAGEVVERPASIVKELIENSIDAGSTKITLRIENGGINYIEVSDNGSGMNEIDAKLSLTLHATSKIKTIEDLSKIHTLGFRGEALASISSVAKVTIHTKTESGTPILVRENNGKIEVKHSNARNTGTTVKIENIFEKIPARRKFLKSELTEYKNILQAFLKLAIPYYSVSFDFYNNSKLVYSLEKTKSLEKRIIQVYPNLSNNLIPVSFDDLGFNILGFIGHPTINRRDTSIQYIFVNKRCIFDPIISKAVKSGFGTNLMQQQHPVYFINIQIDESQIDVNVHPRKNEIRFEKSHEIFKTVHNSVRFALEKHLKTEIKSKMGNNHFKTILPSTDKGRIEHPRIQYISKPKSIQKSIDFTKNLLTIPVDPKENIQPEDSYNEIIQVFNTYIIIQIGELLQVIDQHAADERINYEKILNRFKNQGSIASQRLLLPDHKSITNEEKIKILENKKLLSELGFEIQIENTIAHVLSLPEGVYSQKSDRLFEEILQSITESESKNNKEENRILNRLIATIACHSSIRAGQKLGEFQSKQLIKELLQCSQPYSCPHGRPIIWTISKSDLEKNFKRKL